MGVPENVWYCGLLAVRSGEMASQVAPSSVVRCTNCEPMYTVFGSCGETSIGDVRWKRYFLGVVPVDVLRADIELLLLSRELVVTAEEPLAVGVHDVGVAPLGHGRPGLAPPDLTPIAARAGGVGEGGQARHRDRAVILLAGVHPEGELVVHVHLVQLGGGLVVLGGPALAAVLRDIGAAVVRLYEDVGVGRVEERIVARHQAPGLPAIV